MVANPECGAPVGKGGGAARGTAGRLVSILFRPHAAEATVDTASGQSMIKRSAYTNAGIRFDAMLKAKQQPQTF